MTAYTPYQAEASQGTLQVIFEYQSMISELTAMDVCNASVYDGASGLGEAVLMAVRGNRRVKGGVVLMTETVHPHYRETVRNIVGNQGVQIESLPIRDGTSDLARLQDDKPVAAVVVQQPNFFGLLEEVDRIADWAHDRGALVIALVNEEVSALAQAAHHAVPLCAGRETSVAATKSYIVSLAALALLVGELGDDRRLLEALRAVPDVMANAWECDWSPLLDALVSARSAFVVGRGVGYALSLEAALKLKETSRLHAEAYSTAEVRHGPMALVRSGFPLLVFAQNDATRESVLRLASDARALGARVFVAGARRSRPFSLPCPEPAHALLAPLVQAQSFYRFANDLSIARGYDPDAPPHLSKVTETV